MYLLIADLAKLAGRAKEDAGNADKQVRGGTMRRTLVVTLIIAAVIGAAALTNADAKQTYMVYGVGLRSCGTWTADKTDDIAHGLDLYWVQGSVSGFGFRHDGSMKKTDRDGVSASVDNYCAAHPLDTMSKAAEALVVQLAKQ